MTARLPLRTQLLLLLVGTVALVVLVTGLVGTAALRSYLVDRVDTQLVQTLQVVPPRGDVVRDDQPRFGRGRRGPARDVAVTLLQYDATGALVGATDADRRGSGPDVEDPGRLGVRPVEVGSVEGDGRWRALSREQADGGVVVAAVALDGVDDTVSRLLVINTGVGLLALAGAGLLAAVAVRRSLRPLVTVEETAEAIAGGDLSRRVPATDPRTEVGSLAASFNAMVDRFESAYAAQESSEQQARASEGRMRQFVADASHELRTPLTSIRGFAELHRQGAAPDAAAVVRRIEDEAARMGLLVEDLLLLARLDQARPLRREPVDLLSVAADVVHAAATVHGASHAVRLQALPSDEPPVVVGDDARLHQVLSNLVGNAVAHTADGTQVEVRVQRTGDSVRVEVRDDGEGMSPEVQARVFERFYRADASRTRTGPATAGTGLGLSIVAAIVTAHGGAVEVDGGTGRGSRFTVTLPAVTSGGAAVL